MKYKTIVIDHPWPGPGAVPAFDGEVPTRTQKMKLSLLPYSTASGIQVAAMNIAEISADVAQCFIWATSRSVADAFLLMQLWSFKYRALFIWKKPLGMGRHMRSEAEFLLWGGRKGARLVKPKDCPHQIQTWKKPLRHSEKPAEAYEFIRSLSDGPRIDIFARQHRPGFEPWGNEVPPIE